MNIIKQFCYPISVLAQKLKAGILFVFLSFILSGSFIPFTIAQSIKRDAEGRPYIKIRDNKEAENFSETGGYKEVDFEKIFKLKFPEEYIVEERRDALHNKLSQSWMYGLYDQHSISVHLSKGFDQKPLEEYFKDQESDKSYEHNLIKHRPYKTTKPSKLNWYYSKYYTISDQMPKDTINEYTFIDNKENTMISFSFKSIPQKEIDYLLNQVSYTKPKTTIADYIFGFIGFGILAAYLYHKFRTPKNKPFTPPFPNPNPVS